PATSWCRFSLHPPAATEVSPLSLHDALPISRSGAAAGRGRRDRPHPTAHRRPRRRAAPGGGTAVHRRLPRTALRPRRRVPVGTRSEEHTSELQSRENLVCRLLLEKKKQYDDR